MAENDYLNQVLEEMIYKIRDLEEKQRIIRDQILLIGRNLIELKEKNTQDTLKIKKDIELNKQSAERMKLFLEMFSSEFSKLARKEDIEILSKQAKMFQPLEFVRKKDIEKLVKK